MEGDQIDTCRLSADARDAVIAETEKVAFQKDRSLIRNASFGTRSSRRLNINRIHVFIGVSGIILYASIGPISMSVSVENDTGAHTYL
jgi:hypothetical protein